MPACSKCKTDKEQSSFYKDSTRPNGYMYACKKCYNAGRSSAKRSAWAKQKRKALKESIRVVERKAEKKVSQEMSDGYLKKLMGFKKSAAIPDALIAAKREHMKLTRLIKEITK